MVAVEVETLQRYSALTGRVLFSIIFLTGALEHMRGAPSMLAFTQARGVPWPRAAVLAAGVLMLLGGISILLGLWARAGAALLIVCLLPVTLFMHRPLTDPQQAVHFLKNIALIGGALLLIAHGPGPLSLDALRRQPPGAPPAGTADEVP